MNAKKRFTSKQGRYLSYIYWYGRLHGCAPSEAEMQQYFKVSPPSIHDMVLRLEAAGLIQRSPGEARSTRLRVGPEELPPLE